MTIRAVLARSPVIPVLTIEDAAMATDLAGALIAGGLPVIEITLRTEAGLEAVSRVAKAFPEASVGVGTVLDEADFARARDAGAVFAVSPGLVPEMAGAANAAGIAFLPGVQTSSEIMTARRLGLDTLKFFPAEASGGVYG
ncbi:MAG: keto-deoxy-phosphogluconate aldolase, partial [Rhodospirillaceae bacterium]|nr:keto-deoxy-phosphogluconate aldolase [Rhodospirillaceae bacterium]